MDINNLARLAHVQLYHYDFADTWQCGYLAIAVMFSLFATLFVGINETTTLGGSREAALVTAMISGAVFPILLTMSVLYVGFGALRIVGVGLFDLVLMIPWPERRPKTVELPTARAVRK